MSGDFRANACVARTAVPVLAIAPFRAAIIGQTRGGALLAALFGVPHESALRLHAVLAQPTAGTLTLLCADVVQEYPALTPECMPAHWFERELWEQWRVLPVGHPWLKPIRFQPARTADAPQVTAIPFGSVPASSRSPAIPSPRA